ncbi:MAG: AAA family ATPase, partial [Patescibacteria group bacterium]
LKDKLNKIEQKLKEVNEKVINFTKEEEDKKDRLFLLQKNWQTLQSEVSQTASELNELKINSARYETKLEDLEIEIRHNYGNLSEIKKNQVVKGGLDDDEAIEKINLLKRQLDLIGGIDPEIAKEYNETKTRFDFLFSQVNDLTEAIKSLEEIVKELDINIKEKFDKEFKIITTKFEEYFKILFNGGTAKIIKLIEAEKNGLEKEEMESGEKIATSINKIDQKFNVNKIKFLQKHNATGLAGIEIQATPPGKKIKSVSMLSGGERALTAIALICAIISANPSPFVVLDEVDAALDEANSERLAKILDDLSHKTQFIIITHNRATMRRANILYGVTMGDDGISKLLSVKLEEANEQLVSSKKAR